MKSIFSTFLLAAALLSSAPATEAIGGGVSRHPKVASPPAATSNSAGVSMPEPSVVYAVDSGLALLAVAGWYIRRRK